MRRWSLDPERLTCPATVGAEDANVKSRDRLSPHMPLPKSALGISYEFMVHAMSSGENDDKSVNNGEYKIWHLSQLSADN
jgi:hypothetical protein